MPATSSEAFSTRAMRRPLKEKRLAHAFNDLFHLKRLEENARRAEMFAQQAGLDVQVAELQVKLAKLEAGDPCVEKREFY